MIETSRRFVNTWECDENSHLNVLFYYRHFEDAHVHFWLETGWPAGKDFPVIRTHLVRFHSELYVGDLTLIRSHLAEIDGEMMLCHLLFNGETDALSATCICPLAESDIREKAASAPLLVPPPAALPRSIELAPARPLKREEARQAGFIATYRGLVEPADCDRRGMATTRALIGFQSDAAGYLWNHIGLTRDWLEANNIGRVAVESRISLLRNISAGTPLLIMTGLFAKGRKTISFRHHIYDVANGDQVGFGEITGVAIDLAARRTVEWPKDIAALFELRLVQPDNQ